MFVLGRREHVGPYECPLEVMAIEGDGKNKPLKKYEIEDQLLQVKMR